LGQPPRMSEDPPPDPLARLGEQIDRARTERLRQEISGRSGPPRGALGLGLRMATELAAALIVGLALGWVIDRVFGTHPWGLILFFFLGVAAGMVNVFRAAKGVGSPGTPQPRQNDDRSG
jgi:ATP synthase protein I